ncbi:sentrin-specific protease 7 isoform X2 [Paroedura picta]|uniref:sentrin-specific protease 7 isoform X2 n=1 Tax=Paroedura picta TaxID=143630 RepID=UPI004057A5BB
MEGYGKNGSQIKFHIPKKKAGAQSDEVRFQSPLSRLPDAHQRGYPLKEWKLETRNNSYHSNWERKGHFEKRYRNDEEAAFRQPKVTLTNVLRTKTGRKYVQTHLLADANLSDASNLQSDEETSSVANQSCQKISSQQSCILSKRHGRYRRPSDHLLKPSKDKESSVPALRRCDVVLEDCSIQKKERDNQDRGRKELKNTSAGLRDTCFQNNECRKRRSEGHSSQWNAHSRKKSLCIKEQSTELIESAHCKFPCENHQSQEYNPQQENILQPLELDCCEILTNANQVTVSCPADNSSNISPKRNQHSVISKDVQISTPVNSPKKQEVNTSLPLDEPGNILNKNKQTTDSAEPIVLSSDEEEQNAEVKDTKSCLQTGKGQRPEHKGTEQENVLPLSEELSKGLIESKNEQLSTESCMPKATSNCKISEQVDLVLDLNVAMLFIGNYKGTATGCTRFTTSYIKIPFEVALNKNMELLVDTKHLTKVGLWSDNDSSALRCNAVIFLWLSSNYVEQIETQIGTSVPNKNVMSTEFLFLKLSQSLTEGEQVTLTKILLEVSKRNSTPDLNDFLPWKQAFILLQDISPEENSFIDYNNTLFLQQKESTSVLVELPSQESKLSLTKPSYFLLQKQSGGQYYFSISSAKGDEWKEFQETRSVHYLIVYPPPPAKGGLGVTSEDLECLEYGEFLNDVIIDFYLKYLLLEKAPRQLAEQSHIFSSFFYKCLTRTEKNSEENPNLSLAQRRHKRVKRWTRHVNIFNKDYIFVPVNEESHWYIAVICFPWLKDVVYEDSLSQCSLASPSHQSPVHPEMKNATVRTETVLDFKDSSSDKEETDINSNLQLNDNNGQHERLTPTSDSRSSKISSSSSEIKKLCKRPCILILDSLKATSIQNTVQLLREYLELEWEAKRKIRREFSKSTMVDFCPRVPKQDNSSDCGVYLLQYVETFFQNPIVNFELPLHLDRWFPRQVVKNKREEIRDLIFQLHLQQQS